MLGNVDLTRSEAARLLVDGRRSVEGLCGVCGQKIIGTTRRKYCGASCRRRAWEKRQRALSVALVDTLAMRNVGSVTLYTSNDDSGLWLRLSADLLSPQAVEPPPRPDLKVVRTFAGLFTSRGKLVTNWPGPAGGAESNDIAAPAGKAVPPGAAAAREKI
jgi:hypothetical protein